MNPIDEILAKPVKETEDGKPAFEDKTFQTLVQCFECAGKRLRWNEVKMAPEICSAKDFAENGDMANWKVLDDHDDNVIRADIAHRCRYVPQRGKPRPLTFTVREWQESLHKYAELHPANPPMTYIRQKAEQAKDMTDAEAEQTLIEVLRDALGVDMSNPLHQWAAKAIWVGVIQRVCAPGFPQRIIPVLVGDQDCGKSSFFRKMLPKHLAEYHQPNVNLFGKYEEFIHSIIGMVLGECPELRGAGVADARAFKARIGIGEDYVRLKYQRHALRIKRSMYIVGTANREQALPKDTTGSTRFVVVDCKGPADNVIGAHRTVAIRREMCWTAAARLFFHAKEQFEPAFLPKALRGAQTEANKDHVPVNDAYANDIAEYVKNTMMGEKNIREIAVAAGIVEEGRDLTNLQISEIKMALRNAGCKEVRRTVGEAKVRLWVPPPEKPKVIKFPKKTKEDSIAD